MKLKFKIFLLITMILILSPSLVYGYSFGDYVQKDYISDNELLLKNDSIPLEQTFSDTNDGRKMKTVYLYDLQFPSSQFDMKMPNGRTARGFFGQYFYWTVPNNGNPQNILPLRDPKNFNAMYDVQKNTYNYAGQSYLDSGYSFPIDYPWGGSNWNFKDKGSDPISQNLIDNPDVNELFLKTSSGIIGSPRQVFSAPDPNNYTSYSQFAVDIVQKYASPFYVAGYPNLIRYPFKLKNGLPPFSQGTINKIYMDPEGNWKTEPDQRLIDTYEAAAGAYPSIENDMKDLAVRNYGVDTLINEVKSFLEYLEVDDYADETRYSRMSGKQDWSPNGNHFYTYFGITTPRLMENRDLRFGTKDNPIIDKNGKSYQMQLWDRDRNGDGIYEASDSYQDREGIDTLKAGHKYSLHSFLTMTGKPDDVSFNSDLRCNVFMALNGDENNKKEIIHNYQGVDPNDYNKPMDGHLNVGDVIDYRFIDNIEIPKTYNGQPVTKVTIYTYTPYQYQNYHSDFMEQDDNAISPDYSKLTFNVEAPVRNLAITSFKLYDEQTLVEKPSGNKLDQGKSYIGVIAVKNLNDTFTTHATIQVGISDGLIGQVYTAAADKTVGDYFDYTTDITDPLIKNIPDIQDKNPIPPLKTVAYKVRFTVPNDLESNDIQLTAYVPKDYDENSVDPNKDNRRSDSEDKATLTYSTIPTEENLTPTDIQLYDASTNMPYNTVNMDGTYSFTPNKTYYAIITMQKIGKKKLGEGDQSAPFVFFTLTDQIRPNGDVIKVPAQFSGYYHGSTTDDPVTETLTYKTGTFTISGSSCKLEADVPMFKTGSKPTPINWDNGTGSPPTYYKTADWTPTIASYKSQIENYKPWNYVLSDDHIEKSFSCAVDFTVDNFQLNPLETTVPTDCGTSQTVPMSFSVNVGMINNDPNVHIDKVSIQITDKNGTVVYRKNDLAFSAAQPSYVLSDNFNIVPNYTLTVDGGVNGQCDYQGNNPFYIEINYDRKYIETDYNNNKDEKSAVLKGHCAFSYCNPIIPCLQPNSSNSWGPVTFYYTKRTGTYHSKVCTGTSCSKDGGCTTYQYTVEWCSPDNWQSWTTSASFTENFSINAIYFRSQDTVSKGISGFINIIGNNNGTVRAGQWYEMYVETTYSTTRSNMPGPNPSNSDMCNWLTRYPGYSQPYGTPDYIDLRLTGYGVNEVYPQNYGTGQFVKQYYLPSKIDKFGQSNSRRYIPNDGKDGVINIGISSDPFYGYISDYQHPWKCLCANASAKIYIVGAPALGSQITNEN